MIQLKLTDQFYEDICLFCGNKAKENFESGNYNTYLVCRCQESLNYYSKLNELINLEKVPFSRMKNMKLEIKKTELERELENVKENIKRIEYGII